MLATLALAAPSFAGTPISLFQSHAGNMDFVGAAGTLRSQPNTGNACALNNNSTGTLSGVPGSGTVVAAYLYWGGSGSTPDTSVRLRAGGTNLTVNADRSFTETFSFGGTNYDFFGGMADVTAFVETHRNGSYRLDRLTVNAGAPHCAVQAVISGWALVVVFEDAAEPLRVINVFDGLQFFRASQVTLTPNNFVVPTAPIDGKGAHITWEGDVGNSATLGGFSERLTFDGNTLSDGFNPTNNQFNSTANFLPSTNLHGVDFDIYDISSFLSAGQTSGVSVYSSGGDLVLLAAEIFSATNTPVADLTLAKSHTGNFVSTVESNYAVDVTNNGPSTETGPIVVTDTLPSGLDFVSGSGTGWTCTEPVPNTASCSHPGPVASGGTLPQLSIRVEPDGTAVPGVTNTATVAGALFDNIAGNDSASDPTTVLTPPDLVVVKSVSLTDDPINGTTNPKAIPGANVVYSISVTNQGGAPVDSDTVLIEDPLPPELELFVNGFGGPAPVLFLDGATPSGLSLNFVSLGDTGDDLEFDDGSNNFTYVPSPDADGFDPLVQAIRVRPSGALQGTGSGNPSFELRFRARIE